MATRKELNKARQKRNRRNEFQNAAKATRPPDSPHNAPSHVKASDPAYKERYIEALKAGKHSASAAEYAGVNYRTANNWRKADPEFAAACEEAIQYGNARVWDEITRRAIEGEDEPHYYKDQIVGYINKKSDRMLELIAKARMPEVFNKTGVELSGPGGRPIETRQLTEEEAIKRLQELGLSTQPLEE